MESPLSCSEVLTQADKAAAATTHQLQRPASCPEVVRLIAHRGAGHAFNEPAAPPENTLAAIEYGFAMGADAVEVDVWLTSDDVPVLLHDQLTDRTFSENGIDVTEVPWERLQPIRAGAWKGQAWEACGIPTLGEATTVVPPDRMLILEIEQGPQVVGEVLAVLADSQLQPEQIALISYNLDTVAEVKRRAPKYLAFWIVDTRPRWQIGGWAQGHRRGPDSERAGYDDHVDASWIVEQAVRHNLDGVDTFFSYPPSLPEAIRRASLTWLVWTLNSPESIQQCLTDGAWGITTDNTSQVLSWFRQAGIRTAAEAGNV